MDLKELLKTTIDRKASDLHLTENSPPVLRIDGRLILLDEPPFKRDDLKKSIYAMLSDTQKQKFESDRELDFSLGMEGMERFRVNCHIQKGSIVCGFIDADRRLPSVGRNSQPAETAWFPLSTKHIPLAVKPG